MSDPKVLDRIDEPSDLKQLDPDELVRLAQEIRQLMVKTVARNGGHLAPNLGVVELTLALHLALDSPRDKIVWDVGHQAYVHKILTGRRGEFSTIRQRGGLSGFPRRSESPHDSFDTGHASTSISVALGLAAGRDKNGTDEVVVAVIGDGALTGGVAFEALNQAGHLKTPLIVVLNDNNMSIGKNVGAMASYLARIRFDPAYNRLKQEIEERVKRIPGIGEKVAMVGHHLKEGIKHFLVPGGLFEELGFTYIGPIDGHDVGEVRRTIEWAKQYERPVLIHAVTEKGRGYGPAERKPEDFHGAAPFVVRTGSFKSAGRPPTYTNVFGDCLCRLA
ncbi:MAG: 1-deoxy-D-xylulose-5-phosphate synthase N-terminal domain-containing protein, partial [Terriglobia bacterium]